jgi:hypothetical protein
MVERQTQDWMSSGGYNAAPTSTSGSNPGNENGGSLGHTLGFIPEAGESRIGVDQTENGGGRGTNAYERREAYG